MVAISEPEHEEVAGMSTKHAHEDVLLGAVEAAGRAPSIHNSQPWRFQVAKDRVDVFADRSRWLPVTDADGRDLLLSCGAALLTLTARRRPRGRHRHSFPPAKRRPNRPADPNEQAT